MPQPAEDLLAWFDRHRRDLPWRRSQDPYRVWLSEVMLQQTRVEVVLPYYERFLARFPTVEELAAAEVDEVLTLWSGLGYYRRARQLHAAARQVAAAGSFPRTLEGWLELPGIGPYTAAAVASIAFGVAAPVMDGNVERVVSRWLAQTDDPRSGPARRRLLATAADLLAAGRPGDSNQALMELGATLCTPRRPKCLLCPIAPGCRGRESGDPESYPAARAKRESEKRRLVVAMAERNGRVLLFRRPADSVLLAGTWELPWVDGDADAAPEAALAARYGGSWTLGPRLGEVRHGITYRDLEITVFRAEVAGVPARQVVSSRSSWGASGWFDAEGRAGLPLSSLVGKVLRLSPAAASSAPADGRPARRSRSRRPE
ncbi:MAG TPA: A/G-specific adenine glycosylase [Thermoanaerobaculia bacterium]|nr:A/G-specific adenine glycosylase [Thermoanaerobaculia bacterium]